jgi:hypothetical protein
MESLKMIKWIILIGALTTAGLAQPALVELGRFGGTGAGAGYFVNPCAIDISGDGRLFICDRGNQRVQIFDLSGRFLINIGGFGWSPEKFDQPLDVWARSTINIYVADYNNQRIQRFDKDLNYIGEKTSNPADQEKFQFREVLSTAYSSQGDLFLLDAGANKVIKYNNQDKGDTAFGYYESGAGELSGPVQLELSSDHRVIVSDADILVIFYTGLSILILENQEGWRWTGTTGCMWLIRRPKPSLNLPRMENLLMSTAISAGYRFPHPSIWQSTKQAN